MDLWGLNEVTSISEKVVYLTLPRGSTDADIVDLTPAHQVMLLLVIYV